MAEQVKPEPLDGEFGLSNGRLRSVDALRGAAAIVILIGILIRPADYIPRVLVAGGPTGFSPVDLAPAVLLFLSGFVAVLGGNQGNSTVKFRRLAVLLLLAFFFWDDGINHLIPIGQFFLAAAAATIASGFAAARPVRVRISALVAVLGIHAIVLGFLRPSERDFFSLILGGTALAIAGSIIGSFRRTNSLNRFLAESGAFAGVALGFAGLYYLATPKQAAAVLLNPVDLAAGFCIAAIGISIGLILVFTLLLDRFRIPVLFSVLLVCGENAFAYWSVPFALHTFLFTRFSIMTQAGPILIRDRMFYNVMDMWSQPAANAVYALLLTFVGFIAASGLADRRLRLKL